MSSFPESGAAPALMMREYSCIQAKPARGLMIGYQRYPTVQVSRFPALARMAGFACCDIRINSYLPIAISRGLGL
jgi:hypothetical protein